MSCSMGKAKGLIFLALFYVLFTSSCDSNRTPKQIVMSGPTMGTTFNIKILDRDKHHNEEELSKVVRVVLDEFNSRFSTYIPNSEISKFNSAPINSWIHVSDEFCSLLELSEKISEESAGSFDVTIGPLVNLWGFGPKRNESLPAEEAILTAKNKIGYQYLQLDCLKKRILKTKPLIVDMSAVAKGHATSVLAIELMRFGLNNMMIEIGGELTLVGENASMQPWKIAIEKPSAEGRSVSQVLAIKNASIATSGDYRNYYEVDGRRISHTIDPKSGRPITHNLASVTVISESGAKSDAWATALNVIGGDQAFKLAQKLNLAAYFIERNIEGFSVKYTEAFVPYMVKQ